MGSGSRGVGVPSRKRKFGIIVLVLYDQYITIWTRVFCFINAGVRRVFTLSPAWGRASERTPSVVFCSGLPWQCPWRPVGYHYNPWDLSWAAIASQWLRQYPRVAIGYCAATTRVIALPITRAVQRAMADNSITMARAIQPMKLPVGCNGVPRIAMARPWLGMGIAVALVRHVTEWSNIFPAAQRNTRHVHCSVILVVLFPYCIECFSEIERRTSTLLAILPDLQCVGAAAGSRLQNASQ